MNNNNNNNNSINAEQFICGICLDLLIKPVITPCNHKFCLHCFEASLLLSSKTCPFCRKRISTFARQKRQLLVSQSLWRKIQETFPQKCKSRQAEIGEIQNHSERDEKLEQEQEQEQEEYELKQLHGEESGRKDDDFTSCLSTSTCNTRTIVSQGELYKEFQEMLAQAQSEAEEQKKLEEDASQSLIQEILDQQESELQLKKMEAMLRIKEEEEASQRLIEKILQESKNSRGLEEKKIESHHTHQNNKNNHSNNNNITTSTTTNNSKKPTGVQLPIDAFLTKYPREKQPTTSEQSLKKANSINENLQSNISSSSSSSGSISSSYTDDDQTNQYSEPTVSLLDVNNSNDDLKLKSIVAELEREEMRRLDRLKKQEELDREFALTLVDK